MHAPRLHGSHAHAPLLLLVLLTAAELQFNLTLTGLHMARGSRMVAPSTRLAYSRPVPLSRDGGALTTVLSAPCGQSGSRTSITKPSRDCGAALALLDASMVAAPDGRQRNCCVQLKKLGPAVVCGLAVIMGDLMRRLGCERAFARSRREDLARDP